MITRRVCLCVLLAAFTAGLVAAQEKARPKGPQLPAGIKLVRDLTYGPHERNKLDLYVPEKPGEALPLVVWIHGGGWAAGNKDGGGPAGRLLGRGYAVASINYRLTDSAVFPAQIHDCKAAIRWLRAHAREYGYDGARIGVWGGSAGGHLVALLGTTANMRALEGDGGHKNQSSRVQCVIDWFGPTDFLNWGTPGKYPGRNVANDAVGKLLGGPVGDKLDLAKLASPITHASIDAAPILFVHGDKDTLVPLQQSEIMHAALKKLGVDSTLHVVKGAGHGNGFAAPEVEKACLAFLDRTLKKKK